MAVQTKLATVLVAREQYAAAEPLLVECVKVARTLSDDRLVALSLGNLAIAVFEQRDFDRAAPMLEETVALARSLSDGFLTSQTLSVKGDIELRLGDLESAEASFREILTIADEMKDPMTALLGLERFAELAVATNAPRRAAILWGGIARLSDETGVQLAIQEQTTLENARRALGNDSFDQAWHEGSVMDLKEATRFALNGRSTANT